MKATGMIGALLLASALLAAGSCSAVTNHTEAPGIEVSVTLPSTADVEKGGELILELKGSGKPLATDEFLFESSHGNSYACAIASVSSTDCHVALSADMASDAYKVYIKRDESKNLIGDIRLNIADGALIKPGEGVTLYGRVYADGSAASNVLVSDGMEISATDADGVYRLKSDKSAGSVFIILPSGYEAETDGCLPLIHYPTQQSASQPERHDFEIKKADQKDYTLLVLGDMHLANRTSDLSQFEVFANEIDQVAAKGKKTYALTLGDMTWDLYWISNRFGLRQYLDYINSHIRGITFFHTMGNHDNDMAALSDFDAERPYRSMIAPNYYSFNIGEVHYVVLDNINCDGYDGTSDRNYAKEVTERQLQWLQKDLSHVAADTPVILAMHAPLYRPVKGTQAFAYDTEAGKRLVEMLAGRKADVVSGHTHLSFNAIKDNIHEHNSGAVCGSWWWSGHLSDGLNLCPDGTPGGYGVWTISGKDMKYRYKATGMPAEYQFRAYDLNQVSFSMADVPDFPSTVPAALAKTLQKYFDAYACGNNEVLLNIWNWNPHWQISVTTDDGGMLEAKPVWAYDPLHIAALTLKRFNNPSLTAVPSFITEEYTHFFKVKAPDAGCTLHIKVVDEFGNSYSETMERPKQFSISNYHK